MFNSQLLKAALVAVVLLGSETVEAGNKGKKPSGGGGGGGGGDCKGKNCPPTPPPPPPITNPLEATDNGFVGSAATHPEFAARMTADGGDLFWKAYDFSTSDSYGLTMFRIVGVDSTTPLPNHGKYGPILLLHGFTSDALTWFGRSDTNEIAMASQLAMEGYDVWFGNQRGNQFSKRHPTFSTRFDSQAYWDFDNTTIATRDLPAMLAQIKDQSKIHGNCKKTTVVGHSQGSQHLINGLSRTSSTNRYVSQVVATAPCFIAKTDNFVPNLDEAGLTQLDWALWSLDMHSFFGPEWETVQVPILCAFVGPTSPECIALQGQSDPKEASVYVAYHFAQNKILNRFQEYSELWEWGGIFRQQPLIDISNIGGNIPVRFIWMDQDELCPIADQRPWSNTIGSLDGEVILPGLHGIPAGSNDANFMTQFRSLLTNSAEEMASGDCDAAGLAWV